MDASLTLAEIAIKQMHDEQQDSIASEDGSGCILPKDLNTYDQRYSDFTFRCREFVWPVHRHIIVQRSEFFEKLCSGEYHELEPGEPEPREWTFKNFHPRAIQCIVSWFYRGDYDDSKPSENDIPDYSLKLGIHLAHAADDVGLPVLREKVCRRTARHLSAMLEDGTFFEVLSILQKNKPPDLPPKRRLYYGIRILKHLGKLGDLVVSLNDAETLTNYLYGLYYNDARDLVKELSHERWLWEFINS